MPWEDEAMITPYDTDFPFSLKWLGIGHFWSLWPPPFTDLSIQSYLSSWSRICTLFLHLFSLLLLTFFALVNSQSSLHQLLRLIYYQYISRLTVFHAFSCPPVNVFISRLPDPWPATSFEASKSLFAHLWIITSLAHSLMPITMVQEPVTLSLLHSHLSFYPLLKDGPKKTFCSFWDGEIQA